MLDNALMESTIGLYKTELIKTPTCSPRTTGNSPAPARPRDRGGSVYCIAAAMNRYSLGPL